MIRFAADENVDIALVHGLLRRNPTLDVLRVQEAGLSGAVDQEVLAWAAQEGRVLSTHDIKTMLPLAYARLAAGQPMTGVIAIPWRSPRGRIIEDLLLIAGATQPDEWVGQVRRLPL